MTEFAKDYPRDDETGWLLFPSDTSWRRSLFPEEVMRHPAKMQMHLEKAIIDYVSKPGDVIMDPTAGTGSVMIAALEGRLVICLDIEERYHQLEQEGLERMQRLHPDMAPVTLLFGDCRFLLPIPCNHIITSPPYAGALSARKIRKGKYADDAFEKLDRQMNEYTQNPRNLGKLNNFLYNQAMERAYKLYYESIQPGGTLTLVLKDRIKQGERFPLVAWADRVCLKLGLKPILHDKWKTPGIQFTQINKMHGLEVVEDESIMIYRKEG
mgnify:CR=1 FL=1